MKKIYLIDDNLDGNRSKYGSSFVDEGKYAEVLCSIDKISASHDLSFIDDAACVLLHKTLNDFYDGKYHEDSQKVATIIGEMPNIGDVIPLAVFSDGFTSDKGDYNPQMPNALYNLSKRAFYNRLESFVVHYKDTGEIDLRILAYGSDFKKVIVEKVATDVFCRLQNIADSDVIDATKVACAEMKQIVELAQPAIGKSYNDIINDLQVNDITVGEFKNRINNILDNFQDYGKNYYTWR